MGSSDAAGRASSDAAKNVELWTQANAEYTDENARTNWALDEISWGIWGIDESELNVLGDVDGLDVVELGCGTASVSAWLAKRGARPIGVDVTPAQLATARRMMDETGGGSRASPAKGATAIGVRCAPAPVISIDSCAHAVDAQRPAQRSRSRARLKDILLRILF